MSNTSNVGGVILAHVFAHEQPVGLTSTEFNAPAFAERVCLNLDALSPTRAEYKGVTSITPAAILTANSTPVYFSWGASNYLGDVPDFGPELPYDALDNSTLDHQAHGRYLHLRLSYDDDAGSFDLTSIDLHAVVGGRRT